MAAILTSDRSDKNVRSKEVFAERWSWNKPQINRFWKHVWILFQIYLVAHFSMSSFTLSLFHSSDREKLPTGWEHISVICRAGQATGKLQWSLLLNVGTSQPNIYTHVECNRCTQDYSIKFLQGDWQWSTCLSLLWSISAVGLWSYSFTVGIFRREAAKKTQTTLTDLNYTLILIMKSQSTLTWKGPQGSPKSSSWLGTGQP